MCRGGVRHGSSAEAIQHGLNGLLVDFFSPNDLAAAVADVPADRDRAAAFGAAARETVERTYDLDACVTASWR